MGEARPRAAEYPRIEAPGRAMIRTVGGEGTGIG